jgi:hypothetical protein
MISRQSPFVGAVAAMACLCQAPTLSAQSIEVTPFAGYRFGGDFFEIVTKQPVDLDGAPARGIAVDVPLSNGFQVEGLFTHQDAEVVTPARLFDAARLWRITVDHWQGGGLQEFSGGRIRPFLTGTLGLTRYATEGDNEIRFSVGAGGGVKLFPLSHIGLRLESRVFTTFEDADGRLIFCSSGSGTCAFAIHADLVWQAEFTAGLVVRFH